MSSVGVAEFSTGLRFFGSDDSVKRKTPGWVHGFRPWAPPPPPETFVHEAAATAAASRTRLHHPLKVTRTLPPPRRRLASHWGRCRVPSKTRDMRPARSLTV